MTSLDKKIMLAVLIIALLAGGAVIYRHLLSPQGQQAVVEVDNVPIQTIPLRTSEEKYTITVQGVIGESFVEVDGETVRMIDSACPDKLCVHMGAKSQIGDAIVCLPNRVVIKIKSDER